MGNYENCTMISWRLCKVGVGKVGYICSYGIGPDRKAEEASQAVHLILQGRCHRDLISVTHQMHQGSLFCVVYLNI